jgi:KipI family sensor histidine kinase inhibitor
LRGKLNQIENVNLRKPRQLEVPLQYGGEYGADLQFVADYHHLRVDDVIRIHSEKTYMVYMMGFTPGFPYMGKLDDAIVTPRLETPRTHVPLTVAIVVRKPAFTRSTPRGWRLIGHTSLKLFDPKSESPFLFSPR